MNSVVRYFLSLLRLNRIGVIAVLALTTVSFNAMAVTDAEMDQARAIAAKWYLRYINNGSDYLEKIQPASMADLESQLKNTEKENIEKFKKASTPSNYASWNKEDLVNYWGGTFFKESKSLDPKGQDNAWIKGKVTSAVKQNVKVASAQETPAAAAAPEPQAVPAQEEVIVEEQTPVADMAPLPAEDQATELEQQTEQPKKSSGTWVYVMILCILVAIVIALVVYASKTMKGQPGSAPESKGIGDEEQIREEEERFAPRREERRPLSDDTRMREKFAETLAAKSEEIRNLNRKISELETINASLKEENRRLRAQSGQTHLKSPIEAARIVEPKESKAEAEAPARQQGQPRTIYLGRANARGLFVRADRHAVEGQSIFKLTTTDGVTGSFSLIDSPEVEEQILENPGKWAAGGCFAKDIFDTEGRENVVMENPGTAVFEDGAWKVDRKARIRYE